MDSSPVKHPTRIRRLARDYWLPLVFLGLSLFFLASIILENGYSLTLEDGIFENLTAVFYVAGSLFCFMGFITNRRRGPWPVRYFLLGWASLLFFLGMEEISWRQRVFDVETPEFFASRNLQNETNLHNISSLDFNRLFYSSVFLLGVAIPSPTVLNNRFSSTMRRLSIPLPQPQMIVPFILAFTFASPEWMIAVPEFAALLAVAAVGLSLAIKTNVLKKDTATGSMDNLHLWIGLGGMSLILLVLLLFEDNLGHINQPSEIIEFLFSACFLVFAYGVRGEAAHSSSS
ncbi:MAG: hypothetical protein O2783_06525 [Chloroflexi bacterium]|nr:hypothetical protein [Chloroflexota bacterium]